MVRLSTGLSQLPWGLRGVGSRSSLRRGSEASRAEVLTSFLKRLYGRGLGTGLGDLSRHPASCECRQVFCLKATDVAAGMLEVGGLA